ncbi:MAG: hypothetical protein ACXVLM_13235 [Ilumatobacteraceae bacterium]
MRDTRGVRASGLEGDSPSEIIEIFDDDTDGFGDRAPSQTTSDAGGPRWIGPVAALALAAIIGYGVVTSDSSGGAPKVASAPSTTTAHVPLTTLPAPTTTVSTVPPGPPVPYYAAAPPREYKIQTADMQVENRDYGGRGGYQLWATQGATATSQTWFSINSGSGFFDLNAWNAYRLQTDRGVVAIAHTPYGQTTAQFAAGSNSVLLTAFGWTDDALARLAESITIDDSTGTTLFADPALVDGYQMISAVDPWAAVVGQAPEQVFYATTADPFGGFSISVSPVDTEGGGDFTLDRPTALQFLLDNPTPFTVDGQSAVAGGLVTTPDYALATWTAGDHIVTVAGKMAVQQLIDIAQTVHQVSTAEWHGMQFQAIHNATENTSHNSSAPDNPPIALVPVSFGTDAQGSSWTIRAAPVTYGDVQQIVWDWSSNSVTTTADDTVQINTFVDKDRTYVVADLPRSIAAPAELHVTRAGLDPVVVSFNDIDPKLDRTLAAYAFSEPGPYTAQVVGANGTVLASWASS